MCTFLMLQEYSLSHLKLPAPKFEIEALFQQFMLYIDTKKTHHCKTNFVQNLK